MLLWVRHSDARVTKTLCGVVTATMPPTERIRSTLEGLPEQPPTLVSPTAAAFLRKSLIPSSQLGRRETARAGQPLPNLEKLPSQCCP